MRAKDIQIAYFIGIGGIGMSAIARWFNYHGVKVCGYDKTPSPLTDELEAEGISIHFEDDIEQLPIELKKSLKEALVVYTPAIPSEHKQLNLLQSLGYRVYKRAEVLGLISEQDFTVGIAGTHGKTTTSSMLAHLLDVSKGTCTAFLGGIAKNFNSNLLLPKKENKSEITVIEADEFDRSFLQLQPNIAVVTSVDPDHLDIYQEVSEFAQSFEKYLAKVEEGGTCWLSTHVKEASLSIKKGLKVRYYGLNDPELDALARNIRVEDGYSVFDFYKEGVEIKDLRLLTPGEHNIENMTAAIALALELGCSKEQVQLAVESYAGVKRRFEYIIKGKNFVFMDDYAHHPTEVKAFLSAAKNLYPTKKVTVIFQPHLFSRTKDFSLGFGQSLSLADQIYLLDVYPAREEPIPGVSSQMILEHVSHKNVKWLTTQALYEELADSKPEVLVTLGAGDIFKLIEPICKIVG